MTPKKSVALALLVSIASFAGNFFIFVYGYDNLAVPFLAEGQRVQNANFIMTVLLGAFALPAVLVGLVVYWALGDGRRH